MLAKQRSPVHLRREDAHDAVRDAGWAVDLAEVSAALQSLKEWGDLRPPDRRDRRDRDEKMIRIVGNA